MPVIDISLKDLKSLVGEKLPKVAELEPYIHRMKGEIESAENDVLSIKIGDTNRPDLWCVEGLARELKGLLGVGSGLKKYEVHSSDYKVIVNGKLEKIRPFIACAVIKGLKLTDDLIKQVMQLQDKIDTTYGRGRRKTSIGLYKYDLLKWPLKYTMTKPHDNAFIPLGWQEKLPPHEILRAHPKGIQYGDILKGMEEYPIFIDSGNKVLSMPPIINAATLGEINEITENILIEVTGTDYSAVNNVLKIITLSFADRGGKIYSVQIDYPYRKIDTTPHLETRKFSISIPKVNELLGLKLDAQDIAKLLGKMRYDVSSLPECEHPTHDLEVSVPAYRLDVMHPADITEDIAIAYDYNKFEQVPVAIPSAGKLSEKEKVSNKFRELCIGLGAQEVMNFTLTNKDNLFRKMSTPEEEIIELENPVSLTYGCLRNKLTPGLMEFLSHNKTREFPQKIFEVGDIVHPNPKLDEMSHTERRLALAISHSNVTFTEAKQALESVFTNLGMHIGLVETDSDSFIVGRCASVFSGKDRIGIIGEIHPQVLQNWGLEQPVVCFEVKI